MSHSRRKSDRREMTVSSEENTPDEAYSKDKYSHTTSKTRKKHKKSKKASKHQSESSSDSEGGYDSIKENKTARKHKKKSSKEKYEKYEKKFLEKSKKDKYLYEEEKEEKHKSDKKNKKDISPRRETRESGHSRKRSRSCEKQRYGKWADTLAKDKEASSRIKYDDTEIHERDSKRIRKDNASDKYNRYKNRCESDHEENFKNSHRNDSSSYDDAKHYQASNKQNRRDRSSDNYSREKSRRETNKYGDEENNVDSYSMSSNREKSSYSYNRYKRPQDYVDLDDPNRMDNENIVSENDYSNNKSEQKEKENKKNDDVEPLSKKVKIGNINMRTGGAYIPPAKLRMMQEKIKDKSSEEYQRIAWEALKKSIVGMTNKVNSSNISDIVVDLFKENIIRGRGVLVRAIMQAQGASPTFTRVYAALVAIINTKFPEIGELMLKRLILQYKRGFRRNDKTVCMTAARFLAHLLNQEVAHEILILEMITHLLENPTEDSIEIAISTLKECGQKLTQLTARGMRAITQRVRDVLHEGNVDARVRYMIEVFFAVQKDGFKDFEIIPKELDLVEEEDKFTHLLNLDDAIEAQEMLNVFKFDPEYLENEEKYKSVVKEILGDSEDEEGSGAESDSEGGEENEEEEKKEESQQIVDMTETNIVCLRRKIYLTIQSSLDFEECAHKLLKLELKPGQILEMCYMILDCCAQQRTYEKFFGLLAQRFCQMNKIYVEPFTEIFENSYKTIHRLETNKLRNVAKFFAHLLYTDAISWTVLSIIKLNEEDTTSSSRIFIKILFQELCEYLGLPKLNERVKDVTLQEAFDGLFPRDHPHNTRFAINFFTSIGLGGLTDELREHLKNLPKNPIPVVTEEKASSVSSSSSSSSSSSTSSSSSSSSSDSE